MLCPCPRRPLIRRASFCGTLLGGLALAGCLARGGELPEPLDHGGSEEPVVIESTPVDDALDNLPPLDPHTLVGVDPPHGPPSGGRTALVRGNGFGADARAWLGDGEVPPEQVVVVDATRLQLVTPPGTPGVVSLTVQNGTDESTRRTLEGAYTYDAFEVAPTSGPTTGGTRLELSVTGLELDADTLTVTVDGETCTAPELLSSDVVACTAPPGTPGAKAVELTTEAATYTVLDAFSYSDAEDGYAGGFAGDALHEALSVLVLDDYSGQPIPGAIVVRDGDLATAIATGSSGRTALANPDGAEVMTVTATADCYQPMTLADVPTDAVTLYLQPVLSPACGELGDLPRLGGASSGSGTIEGELLWPEVNEFQRPAFGNVPQPASAGARRAAYVLPAATTGGRDFSLPSETLAVTEASVGSVGSKFSIDVSPGSHTLYALAGVEDRTRSPATFTAYAMGVARGVVARLDEHTTEVFIDVVVPMDHTLELEVEAPEPNERGPDRLIAKVAVQLGPNEHLAMPVGPITRLLPTSDPIRFVGLPPLSGPLAGASYVADVRAVTGSTAGDPSSDLGTFVGTSTSAAWDIEGFLAVPTLVSPAPGSAWDGTGLQLSPVSGAREPSFLVVELISGNGLITWTIVLPGDATAADLPRLDRLGDDLALVPGPLTIVVTAVVVPDFDYAGWTYSDLSSRGWEANARDEYHVSW